MRILLLGRIGQLGWELRRALQPMGEIAVADRDTVDMADADSIRALAREAAPALIVNAAAYTAVDQAEQDREAAIRINGLAPGVLAEEAARAGALLVHYSTDYVFDGEKAEPYVETDATGPLNVYGESKLLGERRVAESGCDFLILRTSWVYAARGKNFLLTILRLAREREALRIVADQIGAPTWARFLAEATAQILARALLERAAGRFESGVFHLTAGGETSWHGFAAAIVEQARRADPDAPLRVRQIVPIPSADYPVPARRPANSRLNCTRVSQRFGLRIPAWDESLALCLEEVIEAGGLRR